MAVGGFWVMKKPLKAEMNGLTAFLTASTLIITVVQKGALNENLFLLTLHNIGLYIYKEVSKLHDIFV